MCEPLKSMGENEAVTKSDLVRFADNLASVIADGPEGLPDDDAPTASEPTPTTSDSKPAADEPTAPPTPPPNPAAEANPDAKQPETKTETGIPPEGTEK